jgi:tetratricopeptide (TPR) repeat protein
MSLQAYALNAARRVRELADEDARTRYPHERDYVDAYWLLGAAYRVNKNYGDAERHLLEALTRCRTINSVDTEGDILIDLARLRMDLNEDDEAGRLAEEALTITERSGYVLQGADAHLVLAGLALRRNDKSEALRHAQAARTLATCDGEPYVYRVAYDEAGVLLEQLK